MAFTALTPKEMKTPFTGNLANVPRISMIIGKINKMHGRQSVAATLTEIAGVIEGSVARHNAFVTFDAVAAAGESMVIDIQRRRAGVSTSILSATYTYDSTKAALVGTRIPLVIDYSKDLKDGDQILIVRTYTAGGGPTPITRSLVVFEPAP